MTDYQSHGGNHYINDTFIDIGEAFSITGSTLLAPPGPVVEIKDCVSQLLGKITTIPPAN